MKDINALFTGDRDLPKEAVWLDVTSFEEIQAMDYSHDKPKTLRVEIKLDVNGVAYEALVDSGASKSILKWTTLVAMVGEKKAIDGLFRNGDTPYFKIADGSVIQSKGQVGVDILCRRRTVRARVLCLREMFSTSYIR